MSWRDGGEIVAGAKLSRDANNTHAITANNGFGHGHSCQVVRHGPTDQ